MFKRNEIIRDFIQNLAKNHRTISFIGQEKGCGKSTAFKAFLEAQMGETIGITSVGTDHLAEMQADARSRRVYIEAETLVATSHQSMSLCDTTVEIINTTGIQSPSGEIILFRAKSAGFVFLAGPSVIADAIKVRNLFFEAGAKLVLFDGAVDRRSPASPGLCDGVVVCGIIHSTSRKRIPEKFAQEMDILLTPSIEDPSLLDLAGNFYDQNVPFSLVDQNNQVHTPALDGTKEDILPYLANLQEKIRAMFIRGALTNSMLKSLLQADRKVAKYLSGAVIVAEDPTKIFLHAQTRQAMVKERIGLRVQKPIKVLGLCLNPFQSGLNREQVFEIMQKYSNHFNLPVLDAFGGLFVERI